MRSNQSIQILRSQVGKILLILLVLLSGCASEIITQAPVDTVRKYSRVAALPIELVIQDERKKKAGLLDSVERVIRDNIISIFEDTSVNDTDELRDLLTERVNYNFLDLGFVPIERTRIQSILKESGFQQTGITSAASASKVGELSNAQSLFFGRMIIQIKGDEKNPTTDLSFSGRLVTVQEGAILLSGTLTLVDQDTNMETLTDMVDEWFDHVEDLR